MSSGGEHDFIALLPLAASRVGAPTFHIFDTIPKRFFLRTVLAVMSFFFFFFFLHHFKRLIGNTPLLFSWKWLRALSHTWKSARAPVSNPISAVLPCLTAATCVLWSVSVSLEPSAPPYPLPFSCCRLWKPGKNPTLIKWFKMVNTRVWQW